jgi:hypothetical protein
MNRPRRSPAAAFTALTLVGAALSPASVAGSSTRAAQGAHAVPVSAVARPAGPAATPAQISSGTAPRTSKGSFQGTWYRSDKQSKLAFWIEETKSGKVRLRYRYQIDNGGYGDSMESGSGNSYSLAGAGPFTITYALDKDGVIRGSMTRTWTTPGREIVEHNKFEIYRVEPGDRMVCRNFEILRQTNAGGVRTSTVSDDYEFVFMKATDEIVHWEELLF